MPLILPMHKFFLSHPWVGFLSMSIVVFITGAEALYADMGHFEGALLLKLGLWLSSLP